MVCNKCGTEVTKDNKFCPKCGVEVKKQNSIIESIILIGLILVIVVMCVLLKYYAIIPLSVLIIFIITILINRELLKRRKKNKTDEGIEEHKLSDAEMKKLTGNFVSREEKYLSSLGNGYIMNFFSNGNLKRGFAVISDKRVYFRGSCFYGQGKKLRKTDEERTVDIKDVTGSGFIYRRYLGVLFGLFIALLALVGGVIGSAVGAVLSYEETMYCLQRNREAFGYYMLTTIALAGVGLLVTFFIACIGIFVDYLSKRKTLFEIQYAGGTIAFDVSFYAKAEIDDFQKQLRRAKDFAQETATVRPVTVETPAQVYVQSPIQNSVPDELRKYADLLKEGLISQEEYDVMKKKILGL